MNLYQETVILLQKLTEAWGGVIIACDKDGCTVASIDKEYTAATFIEALRLAENAIESETA